MTKDYITLTGRKCLLNIINKFECFYMNQRNAIGYSLHRLSIIWWSIYIFSVITSIYDILMFKINHSSSKL